MPCRQARGGARTSVSSIRLCTAARSVGSPPGAASVSTAGTEQQGGGMNAEPSGDGAGTALLRVANVAKAFGATQAVRDASFELRAGEVHALVGENGCGKSTMVKILSGVHTPDAGEIELDGEVVPSIRTPREAQSHGIFTVFQEVLVAESCSVLDNVWLGADGIWTTSVSPREKAARAKADARQAARARHRPRDGRRGALALRPPGVRHRPRPRAEPEDPDPRRGRPPRSTWPRATGSSSWSASSRAPASASSSSRTAWTRSSRSATASRSCGPARPWPSSSAAIGRPSSSCG